jgi:glycogen debranching enzyme
MEQADGTAWMGMYCLNMLAMALELARTKPAYEDVATKFFEHFIYIANAIKLTTAEHGLWNEEDGFFYDTLHTPGGTFIPMKLRSFVGLIPLCAVETLEPDLLEILPAFRKRMEWFIENRPHLAENIASLNRTRKGGRRLLSLVDEDQLKRVLNRMLDEAQFLSPFGLRSLSKEHELNPYTCEIDGQSHIVRYEPAESNSGLFGGNSNWRGPIWFPVNFLMIESLQKYHHYYGSSVKVPMPSNTTSTMDLNQVAVELSRRLINIFVKDENKRRPFYGGIDLFQDDPHWRDHILFYEYFHGDGGPLS